MIKSARSEGNLPMVRSCRVAVTDMQDITHTVEVSAETLFEAVALGLAAIRGKDWVEPLREEYGVVHVAVTEIPVKHTVQMKEFNAWLVRDGGAPRDIIQRTRARKILGLPGTR
jgi:hypothetical protein